MTIENVISVIQGVGFPIAMCIALFWYQTRQEDKIFHMFTEITDDLKESLDSLTTAVERSLDKDV